MGTQVPNGGKRVDAYTFAPEDLIIIGYDTKDGPEHRLYDARVKTLGDIDMAIVRNVMTFGVHTPVIFEVDDARPTIIAGRHRVVWAREANKLLVAQGSIPMRVPGVRKNGMDAVKAFGVMVSENSARVGTTILQDARHVLTLFDMSQDLESIADFFGKSKQTIRNYQLLMSAHPDVIKAVEADKIPSSSAYKLAAMLRSDQPAALAEMLASGNVTARGVEAAVRATKRGQADAEDDTDSKPVTYQRPSIAEIRKMIAYLEKNADALDPQQHNLLRWFVGEVSARSVTGLAPLMRAAGLVKSG